MTCSRLQTSTFLTINTQNFITGNHSESVAVMILQLVSLTFSPKGPQFKPQRSHIFSSFFFAFCVIRHMRLLEVDTASSVFGFFLYDHPCSQGNRCRFQRTTLVSINMHYLQALCKFKFHYVKTPMETCLCN